MILHCHSCPIDLIEHEYVSVLDLKIQLQYVSLLTRNSAEINWDALTVVLPEPLQIFPQGRTSRVNVR